MLIFNGAHQRLFLVGCLAVLVTQAQGWTPGTGSANAISGFVVDTNNRRDVQAYYLTVYNASESYASHLGWTGSVINGVPGTTASSFKDDVRRRINFYRGLVGLPADITFDATALSPSKSLKDQDAALMFSKNNTLSHTPPSTWTNYTANGATAAGNSNIALGTYGPGSIDAYIRDDGSNNTIVGHRRWLVYSRAADMGTGDVPKDGSYLPANALWVITDFKAAPTPQFVSWPNSGYVPVGLVPARWSLSYPSANFGSATVTMKQGATSVGTTIISNVDNGYGDNTLVWTPASLPSSVAADTPYTVTVSGISGSGVPTSYTYTVTLFDPAVLGESVAIIGSNSPATTGASYTFNSISQADSYELKVATGSAAAWTEGAEDAPAPQITSSTTGTYSVRQTTTKRTGSKAFHLAFPDFNNQSIEVTRDLLPTASSQLQFYEMGRFGSNTSTINAEVSTDNGTTWTQIYSRPGVGLNSNLWDPAFVSRSVNLSAYAGQIIHIRFIYRHNNSAVISTTDNDGFFLDDITVTNATQLVSPTSTTLAGNSTSFTLNSASAGANLNVGTTYYLRIRPNVGTKWFGYGAFKTVTAIAPVGYAVWSSSTYSSVSEGAAGFHLTDGISNGLKYAFGLNPLLPATQNSFPKPTVSGGNFTVTYTASAVGVTYGAEWSADLKNWNTLTDTGTGSTHTFSVSIAGKSSLFFRHKVVIAP